MASQIEQNERTAVAQEITDQPDGPGKRIGKRGELTLIGNVAPGGAKLFRERLPQFQAEAAYWEERVGTVHEFRVMLFDNDTRFIATVVYDGDFKPYLVDITTQAHPWLNKLAVGVLDGFPGLGDPKAAEWIESVLIPADFFYASNPDVSVRDIKKLKQLGTAFNQMLDAAS